jgi:hypothetical protein
VEGSGRGLFEAPFAVFTWRAGLKGNGSVRFTDRDFKPGPPVRYAHGTTFGVSVVLLISKI